MMTIMHEEAIQKVRDVLGKDAQELFSLLLHSSPKEADVIVFLQGDRADRVQKAAELFRESFSKKVLISGNNTRDPHDMTLQEIQDAFVDQGVPLSAIIMDDQSLNTLEQAQNVIHRAKEEGWKTLLLVTAPFHALRSYLCFMHQADEQGWNGSICMQVADTTWNAIPSGREQAALALLEQELVKIQSYSDDLATIQQCLLIFR